MASPRGGSTGRRTSRASAVTMEAWLVIERSTALPPFEIVNFVAKQREGDPAAVRLSFREGFGHVKGLFRLHARRHRWLERIDDGFAQRGTIGEHHRFECRPRLFGSLAPETDAAAGLGKPDEIDRLERYAVFGIAKKDHLFPFDHSERVVLDDDDLDRQPILHGGGEFAHEHREA